MRFGTDIIAGAFGVYFVTVVSLAMLVASGTTGPWYSEADSHVAYSAFLLSYAIILAATLIISVIVRGLKPKGPSLRILAGPVLVASLFVGLASTMLPASSGFLQSNFRLNTTFILTLSYAWVGLAFYASASVAHVLAQRE